LVAGTGWRTLNLTANMSYLQAQLVPNWFAVGINTYGGANSHNTCRNCIIGYSNANKPQLIVNYYPQQTSETVTICSNELPYNWYGNIITGPGTNLATRSTEGPNGCELLVSLNLNVNPTDETIIDTNICSALLPLDFYGQSITGSGTYTHINANQNQYGCDRKIILNLTVSSSETATENISICSNQLPYTWNGQVINAGGTAVATHTTQNPSGCDVITTLNLTVNPSETQTDDITIC